MEGRVSQIGDYTWEGSLSAWVGPDGKQPDKEKQWELEQEAKEAYQLQVMARLEAARKLFHSMPTKQERLAALDWLRVAYNL